MADRYLYGSVSSPSAGENVRRQLGAGDHALIAGFKRASGTVEIDSNGAVSLTAASNYYTYIDGAYFVPGDASAPGNRGFKTLLTALEGAGTAAIIQLGPGYHQIDWTTATSLTLQYKIIGSGKDTTFICLNSTDADCVLSFTKCVQMESLTLYGDSLTGTHAIQLGGDESVLRDMIIDVDSDNPTSQSSGVHVTGNRCTLENVTFQGEFAAEYCVRLGDGTNPCADTKILGCVAGTTADASNGCLSTYFIYGEAFVTNCVVDRCAWRSGGSSKSGIHIETSGASYVGDHWSIQNSWLEMFPATTGSPQARAIWIEPDAGFYDGWHTICNNRIICKQTGDYYSFALIDIDQRTVFSNNVITAEYYGWQNGTKKIIDLGGSADNSIISGNIVNAYRSSCFIEITGACHNVAITGNRVYSMDVDGASVSTLYGAGVRLYNGISGVDISGNYFDIHLFDTSLTTAFVIGETGTWAASNMTINGNMFYLPAAGTYTCYGIQANIPGVGASISSSVLTGNGVAGDTNLANGDGSNNQWGTSGTTQPGANDVNT